MDLKIWPLWLRRTAIFSVFALVASALLAVSPAGAQDTSASASVGSTAAADELVDEGAPSVTAPSERSAPNGVVSNPKPRVANCNNGPQVKWAYGKKVAPGTWRGTRWVCNKRTGKYVLGFCVDKNQPEATVVRIVRHHGALAGYSEEQSRRVKFIANKYSKTRNWRTAMRAHFAVYMVTMPQQTLSEMRSYVNAGTISQADLNAAKSIYQASEKHGPYSLKLEKPAKGNTVKGIVKSFHGYAAPAGGKVTVKKVDGTGKVLSVNGRDGRRGAVRGDGMFVFRYTPGANATYQACVSFPSHDVVLINVRSTANSQRILIGGFRSKVCDKVRVKTVKNRVSYKDVCSEDCDGTAELITKVCHTPGVEGGKFIRRNLAGQNVGRLFILRKNYICSTHYEAAKDGQVTDLYYCAGNVKSNKKCASGWKRVAGSRHEVVCPEWPKAELVIGCSCGSAWAKGRFYVSSGLRSTHGYLKVTDEDVVVTDLRDIVVTPGQWTEVPITEKVRAGLVLEASFAVFKSESTPRQLVPRTVLVKVRVLETAASGKVTYRETKMVDGRQVVNRKVAKTVDAKFIAK